MKRSVQRLYYNKVAISQLLHATFLLLSSCNFSGETFVDEDHKIKCILEFSVRTWVFSNCCQNSFVMRFCFCYRILFHFDSHYYIQVSNTKLRGLYSFYICRGVLSARNQILVICPYYFSNKVFKCSNGHRCRLRVHKGAYKGIIYTVFVLDGLVQVVEESWNRMLTGRFIHFIEIVGLI